MSMLVGSMQRLNISQVSEAALMSVNEACSQLPALPPSFLLQQGLPKLVAWSHAEAEHMWLHFCAPGSQAQRLQEQHPPGPAAGSRSGSLSSDRQCNSAPAKASPEPGTTDVALCLCAAEGCPHS